ncbi:unnamed protein product [Rotaria sp. Silwood2]|nr:unnamed protein product [Rotaria sp. Silwood2]CAF3421482.1 unnamed protein product [Rotaria sp. Silwood2]CAF4445528.1 unnamed protein product [Rotaria sp. Silwood2]CAF4453846.1 unnamed protein product [Rotaria sp. Silwood2]CAF4502193.1 unnamed protein product [Rotaria sp. Silwood2]
MDKIIVRSSSLFGDQAESQPIVIPHFTRPSNINVFSLALWNVFTNYSSINLTLPSNLCLNDAVNYFVKHFLIDDNPLNFVVIKFYQC